MQWSKCLSLLLSIGFDSRCPEGFISLVSLVFWRLRLIRQKCNGMGTVYKSHVVDRIHVVLARRKLIIKTVLVRKRHPVHNMAKHLSNSFHVYNLLTAN